MQRVHDPPQNPANSKRLLQPRILARECHEGVCVYKEISDKIEQHDTKQGEIREQAHKTSAQSAPRESQKEQAT